MEGWIKLYRKIREHCFWTEKRKYSKFEAWIDILFRVNHKDEKVIINGQLINVKKGSFITSEVKLAETWNWNRKTIRRFLKTLENEKMILKKSTAKYTSVSVENWELYQNKEHQNIQQEEQQEGQEGDNRGDTDKKIKNDKNKRNISKDKEEYIPASEETSSASAKASKHRYGKYKNVLLKDKELQSLKEEYQNWEELIKYLDEYIEMKGYKAKSHYLCIKKWVVEAVNKERSRSNGSNRRNIADKVQSDVQERGGFKDRSAIFMGK